jgi:predicted CXXCH cytochrome family protein
MIRLRSAFLLVLAAGLARPAAAQQNPHGTLPAGLECGDCHTPNSWKPDPATVKFDHNRQTGFKLVGRHRDAACRSCHLSVKFDESTLKGADCATCHADVHRGAYAERCASCHTAVSFADVPGLQIHARTTFPLTGAHAQITCRTCHVDDRGGAFAPVDPQCIACHRADYERASPVNHVAANYPTDCTRCHVTLAWPANVSFDHVSLSNGFRLLGAHARVRCTSCHAAADMTPLWPGATDQECLTCHQPDYDRAHPGNSFPQTCLSCHTMETWAGATFDHALVGNGFRLQGAHASLACSQCHAADMTPLFTPASDQDCVTCHQPDYQRAHPGNSFSTTCTNCHTVQSWGGATFDHAQVANGFRLQGTHASLTCTQCHAADMTPLFHPANDQDCISCHQPDYQQAHPGNSFPTTCTSCHTVESWGGATFNHAQLANGFRLQGAHASLTCAQCHAGDGTPLFHPTNDQDCVSCHAATFQAAPNHVARNYPQTCLQCHTQTTWQGATFVHSPSMTDCVSCHLANFQAAPNHVARNYPQTCLQCHTQTTWQGATFAHTPSMTDCASCHHADFVAATTPVNHTTQGIIEAACSQCHTNSASSWQQTTYVHGNCYNSTTNRAHQNARCVQCHASGYPAATCTACHQNRASCG